MSPKIDKRGWDAAIAALAGRQHGQITTAQLLAVGLSRSAVRDRVRASRLHRRHQGVYSVGHAALSNEGRWMAAVLACGEGAVLSHRSAAEHWRMLNPRAGWVQVTLPGTVARRRSGIVAHRVTALPPSQTTVRFGVPVTSPARTLADLKRTGSSGEFKAALREADFLRLPVADVVSDGTGNDFEGAFFALCRRHRLPLPQVRVEIGPYEVDFLWPDAKLIVETDGWQGHSGWVAFQEDRERDLYLKVRGYEVVRLSYVQVKDHGAEVAAALRALLVRRAAG